ncbi:MAG TPA: hypothetical protein VFO30_00510 [Chthoniobacterales bacterium]|nr:hypothetical protein [Chthoniobacterales bacterium]
MSRSRHTRSDIVGAVAAGTAVLVFCLLLLWHDPLVFWNDDYELSVLPVFADVARSWSEGHWPLLSPYSWVCNNLAGEFQYGTFSVFVNAAVVLIWKFPLSFAQQAAAISIIHLVVLAIGALLLARGRALSIPLSIFVAIIAALNGWIICWGATDWFGALGAFAWLPWAWWACERALKGASASSRCSENNHRQDADATRSRWRFLWPAPFVYLVITGGFPYTVLMLALVVAWLSIKSLGETKQWMSVLPMLVGVALGAGLAAPAWLALLDYVHGSARQLQTASAHWQWIVPWRALPGLVLPAWTVNWPDFSTRYLPHAATELACGLVAPSALIAGFIWRPKLLVRHLKWELLLLLLVLLLAMLPTAGVFRWSFRWLPLFHLVLAICGAEVLRLRPGSPTGSASVLLLILVTIAVLVFNTAGKYGLAVMFVYYEIAVIWVVGEWFLRDRTFHEWAPAVVTFSILLATYICIPPNCGVPKYNFSQKLLSPSPLDPQRLYLSIYPPTEHTYRVEKKPQPVGQIVRPGSTSMWATLRFVNGYSPILAAGVAREFNFAIHGEIDPAMGDYLLSDRSGLLQQLGIDGLIIAQEIATNPASPDWQLVFSNNEGRVFHWRGGPLPRVRSVNEIDSHSDERFVTAAISRIDDSRNRVELDVDVPSGKNAALLEFSRPYFRGYVARLGNINLAVDSYRGLIPLVKVPPGSHGRLILTYRPAWLVYGGALSILCAAIFSVGVVAAAVTGGRTKNNVELPRETAAATSL